MAIMVTTKDDPARDGALLDGATDADSDAPVSGLAGAAASGPVSASDRRNSTRYEVSWSVDCVGDDTFLFASMANISEMGIFVLTREPLAIGTRLMLSFSPPGHEPFKLAGQVAWINKVRANGDNPNPGMGVGFIDLTPDDRERIVDVIRAICYLRPGSAPS